MIICAAWAAHQDVGFPSNLYIGTSRCGWKSRVLMRGQLAAHMIISYPYGEHSENKKGPINAILINFQGAFGRGRVFP